MPFHQADVLVARLQRDHDIGERLSRVDATAGRVKDAFVVACDGPVRFLLPEGGVSLIDASDQPIYGRVATEVSRPRRPRVRRATSDFSSISLPSSRASDRFVLRRYDKTMLATTSDERSLCSSATLRDSPIPSDLIATRSP